MFKKGPDIDKKKLLAKAFDIKKDSLTRLKHFKSLIEHLHYNEVQSLYGTHYSFIYHTFIDTFSVFDCNSKQRRDDLECILYMFEQILIHNPEKIKKRWQFYSITFVMQRLLHQKNTWQLRQEGVRLFVLWYQILCDESNAELQQIFGNLVPNLVPKSSLPISSPTNQSQIQQTATHLQHHNQQQKPSSTRSNSQQQLPIKQTSIEPLVPASQNEETLNDEQSFYLDNLLQYMVTQTTKPYWTSPDEARKNQELGFSFVFNMFKRIYLQYLFPNFINNNHSDYVTSKTSSSHLLSHSISQYVDDVPDLYQTNEGYMSQYQDSRSGSNKRAPLQLDVRQSQQNQSSAYVGSPTQSRDELERSISLSGYQAIVIKWLTRILRQDMILGQDELIRSGNGGSVERRDANHENKDPSSTGHNESDLSNIIDGNSTAIFNGIETTSREMEIARRVIGTWPENISVVHELFRRAFLNFYQPASMKRVVNVYKEWICNGGPNQAGSSQSRNNPKIGYTSFNDLLQTFVSNSSNAFLTRVHNPNMLDEQFEMCKRIMNIYRYMVMKIYMNTPTWEQLLNVMLSITQKLFPVMPPEKKESTIGGRIAPAFFQTFIVSWIRANLYVHISSNMWVHFHGIMRNLVRWHELIEEWSTTMSSLTRVLVKHVYGLSLTDLPLDRPQEKRRRPKALKSFSTAETGPKYPDQTDSTSISKRASPQHHPRSGSIRLPTTISHGDYTRTLRRSNSDGLLSHKTKLYYSSSRSDELDNLTPKKVRKIKSEYLIFASDVSVPSNRQSHSPMTHNDAIDGTSLKDSMILENEHALDSHHSEKSSMDMSGSHKSSSLSSGKRTESRLNSDKCVLLGGNARGWTPENSIIMWRRMLGLFGNINQIEDPDNHLIAVKCLGAIVGDFIKVRENLGISVDNQPTPDLPNLIPPYTFPLAWLLEITHMPVQYKESTLLAYNLLCTISIRRHDIELPQQYYTAYYEALHRGLCSNDRTIQAAVIKNTSQLFSLELPGATFLVHELYERSRSMLLNFNSYENNVNADTTNARDHAVQLLSAILSLNKPVKKLMVLRSDGDQTMSLVASGDIKTKIFDTLLACHTRPVVLDSQSRLKSLSSLTTHVYQELFDRNDSMDVERLFDAILTELQDLNNSVSFRINCDMLRLFADHAQTLTNSRPVLVSSLIQIVSQLIVRLSTDDNNKEFINFLLICLEDWCMAAGKVFMCKPIEQMTPEEDETLSTSLTDTLITIVIRSLQNVINDEQFTDDSQSNKGVRGSQNTSKNSNSDALSSGRVSQGQESSSGGSCRETKTLTNELHHQANNKSTTRQVTSDHDGNKNLSAIKLACKVSLLKLVTYMGHFPLRQLGPASMSCCVNEFDYLAASEQDQLDAKSMSELLFLVIDGSTIITLVGVARNNDGLNQPVHLIVRNLCGRYSWDASCVEWDKSNLTSGDSPEKDCISFDADSFQEVASRASMKYDSDFNDDGNSSSSLSSRSSSNRDCIGDLLNYLSCSFASANGYSISSAYQNMQRSKRNTAQSVSNARYKIAQAEETMIALLTNHRFQELNHCEKSDDTERVVFDLRSAGQIDSGRGNLSGDISQMKEHNIDNCARQQNIISFEQCRQLIQQLGYLSWDKRRKIESLAVSPRLMRELKNLDAQSSRETHKIAVIYVAQGQEDKNSILSNSSGSRSFEEFVSGLGWEVNLSSHLGFKGGLQSNKSTGETSPYYCNGTTEIMFHVSTRIPLNGPADDESLNKKLRHLGNDEIHIIWSEHTRDYRRGIIPTEFGDVIIAIYPMLTFQGYFRIQISSKPDVPPFGPLFDNHIVHQSGLAALVRATCINASRAKRLKLPYFQAHFEERSRLIDTIVQNHKEKLSFEEYSAQFFNTSLGTTQSSQETTKTTDKTDVCCA